MQKIEKEALSAILPVKLGRNSRLRVHLLQLAVGEGLFMPKEEWKSKNTPAYVISHLKKTTTLRFEYGMKPDGSGWMFRRLS